MPPISLQDLSALRAEIKRLTEAITALETALDALDVRVTALEP